MGEEVNLMDKVNINLAQQDNTPDPSGAVTPHEKAIAAYAAAARQTTPPATSNTVSQILQTENNQVVDYAKNLQAGKKGTETEPPVYEPGKFYNDFQKQYAGRKPLTPEEQKAAERRERTNKIIAGVGDMISALSNLYFTTKGAPNAAINPASTMSANMQNRYDQLRKEREALDNQYYSGLQRAQQLDQQYALSWQQLKEQRKLREQQQKRQEQQDADAKSYKEEMLKIQREKLEEQERAAKAREEIQRTNAAKKGSGKGGRKKGTSQVGRTVTTYDKNGKPIRTVTTESGVTKPSKKSGSLLP